MGEEEPVNFEQYAVIHKMSPISQTPSDQLIVSDEQLKNRKRLVDKIEKPVMNPSILPRNPITAQIHARQYARLPTGSRAKRRHERGSRFNGVGKMPKVDNH